MSGFISTIVPASKSTGGKRLFEIVDNGFGLRGEIDKAGKVVECWKGNAKVVVDKLGPLARKILKQV